MSEFERIVSFAPIKWDADAKAMGYLLGTTMERVLPHHPDLIAAVGVPRRLPCSVFRKPVTGIKGLCARVVLQHPKGCRSLPKNLVKEGLPGSRALPTSQYVDKPNLSVARWWFVHIAPDSGESDQLTFGLRDSYVYVVPRA
jgi:hypothetical protein